MATIQQQKIRIRLKAFDRRLLDENDVRRRVELVTRGWLRLQEIFQLPQPIPLPLYPLPEFIKPIY